MKLLLSAVAICCLLAIAPSAQAGPLTYTLVIGSVGAGTVSGSITTDGALGILTQADILDWNIVLQPNPGSPFTLLGPLSGNNSGLGSSGNDFFTTGNRLYFDFSLPGYSLFQNPSPGSGVNYLCFAGNGQVCGNHTGPGFSMGTDVFGANFRPEQTDSVLVGTAAVPEPGTVSLLSLSLLGLGLLRRSRS